VHRSALALEVIPRAAYVSSILSSGDSDLAAGRPPAMIAVKPSFLCQKASLGRSFHRHPVFLFF
jgi:hypothetical protein